MAAPRPTEMAFDYPIIRSDDGSKQPMFLAVTGTLLLLSTCVVGARFYCRATFAKRVGLDDYSIGLATLVALVLGIMNGFHISYGAGTHDKAYMTDPTAAYIPNLKHWYAYQIIYPISLFLVKASFLALYHRVFPPPNINRYLFWGTFGFIALYTFIIVWVNAFECPKPSDAWSPAFPGNTPQCNSTRVVYFTMAAINIFTDLAVLFLPIKPALKLNVNRKKKYAIVGIFMIGGIAVLASVLRVYFLHVYFTTTDPVYDTIEVLLWSQIELNVAIICSSIASLRPLFKSAFGSSNSRSAGLQYTPGGASGVRSALRSSQYGYGIELAEKGRERPNTKIEAALHSMGNDSQEYILNKDDGIKRTIETRIVTEQAVDDDRDGLRRSQGV